MTKPKTYRFLVVVVQANPSPIGVGSQGLTYTTMNTGPTFRASIEATSAKEAADKVGVPAGATAYVAKLAHVTKFKRPQQADLEAA